MLELPTKHSGLEVRWNRTNTHKRKQKEQLQKNASQINVQPKLYTAHKHVKRDDKRKLSQICVRGTINTKSLQQFLVKQCCFSLFYKYFFYDTQTNNLLPFQGLWQNVFLKILVKSNFLYFFLNKWSERVKSLDI